MELGILSLGDLQRDQRTGRLHRPVDRMAEILGYAVLADQLGLDRIFAQVDWGGLPSGLVEESIARYAAEIAPALRSA